MAATIECGEGLSNELRSGVSGPGTSTFHRLAPVRLACSSTGVVISAAIHTHLAPRIYGVCVLDAAMPDGDRTGRGGRPRDPSRDTAIQAAILQILTTSGYAGLTIEAVAATAGVGKATIYRRWRSKSDLLADTIQGLHEQTIDVPLTGSLETDLRVLLRRLITALNGPVGKSQLSLLSALPYDPSLRTLLADEALQSWMSTFASVWNQNADEDVSSSTAMQGATVASVACRPVIQRWLFSGKPIPLKYADEVLHEVVLPLHDAGSELATWLTRWERLQ